MQKILSLVTISIDNLLTSRLFNWENKVANAKKKKAAKVTTRVVESGDTVVPKKQKTDKKSVKVAPKKQKTDKKSVKVAPKEAQISKKENKKSTKKGKKKKIGYFKGAWIELKQVHWPDRKSTWGMTFAVVLFTLFFVVLILLLDAGFKYLFDFIIK